jgi:hypothetical protein
MAAGDHLRYGMPLARDLIDRLRAGEGPTGRELADAMCLEQWQLAAGGETAPYLIKGQAAGRAICEALIAHDPAVGWARTFDRWFVLGQADPTAQPAASPYEVIQGDRRLDRPAVGWRRPVTPVSLTPLSD